MAVRAGEIGVAEIQLDYGPAAVADERVAEVAEPGLDVFQGKGLGSTAVTEFNRTAGKPNAR